MGRGLIRVGGILIKDKKILLIHRLKEGREYYVIPGGGIEEGETVEEAIIRELKEETNIEVKVKKLLYVHKYPSNEQYYYLCDYVKGRPKLRAGSVEKQRMLKGEHGVYEPVWVNISNLSELLIYPLEITGWLLEDLKKGFQNKPRVAKLATK